MATITAKKLIGKEINLEGILGNYSKPALKQKLKQEGKWMDKDNKFEISWEESEHKLQKYSDMFSAIEELQCVKRIEELDWNSRNVKFFKEDDKTVMDVVKEFELLPFVNFIKVIRKLEVR